MKSESEDLLSLTHYAGDEVKLVDEMFACIQGTKLEAMMPQALKVSTNRTGANTKDCTHSKKKVATTIQE